jgi:hypothetical protein
MRSQGGRMLHKRHGMCYQRPPVSPKCLGRQAKCLGMQAKRHAQDILASATTRSLDSPLAFRAHTLPKARVQWASGTVTSRKGHSTSNSAAVSDPTCPGYRAEGALSSRRCTGTLHEVPCSRHCGRFPQTAVIHQTARSLHCMFCLLR